MSPESSAAPPATPKPPVATDPPPSAASVALLAAAPLGGLIAEAVRWAVRRHRSPALYLTAAIACIGLIGFYLSAVLKSRARGMAFAGMLAMLYAALYGLLVLEDNALAVGAGLLFAILAAIMVATRKVDWYALASRAPLAPKPAE